jgi:hypothetical protein
MPTADLRKFRQSTLSVKARKAIKPIRSRPKKNKSPAELEAKLREIHIDTTPHPRSPIEHGLSESAKKHTTRLANFLREALYLQMGKNAHFPMHINQ